jgi:SAM-dependent methyltransferase
VRLRLFDILFKGPLTIAALAERLLLSPEATSRLLDAAVSLGLAERRGRSVYGLGQLGAALAGNRAALSLIEHQPLLYADLQDPVALLRGSPRGTGIARYWPYSAATHPTELTAPMPDGADVISLIRIVHDHDDASAVTLLRAVHRALPPNGTLLIAEAMSGVGGAEPLDAYYGFYTLAMGRGEPRTVAEISRLLRQAGFSRFRLLRNRMPILTSILVARRTSS